MEAIGATFEIEQDAQANGTRSVAKDLITLVERKAHSIIVAQGDSEVFISAVIGAQSPFGK